jgi:Carboxypeptidase regulatory-like domain
MRSILAGVTALCFVFSTPMFAQSNATLSGAASDATGALIPGVSVSATNTQTGVVTSAVSNEAGTYNFASLQPGVYRVSAELPGFQTQTYTNVELGTSQQVRLNFALPNLNINSSDFGRIPADQVTGARQFQAQLRFNF